MEDNQTSMGDWLQKQWVLEHRSLRHEDQSKIPGSKKHASGMGPCGLAGTCSCSRPGDQQFCKKLTQLLRRTLWKRRGVACPARLDYEAGRLVVSLKISDGEQEVFFFPGYTNYTTWNFAAVLLRACERQDEDGVMKLVFGEEDTHVVESPWRVLADLLTMQALVRKFVDVSKPCSVRFWRILEDERILPVWQMQPRFVDVCLQRDDLAFWKGQDSSAGKVPRTSSKYIVEASVTDLGLGPYSPLASSAMPYAILTITESVPAVRRRDFSTHCLAQDSAPAPADSSHGILDGHGWGRCR